MSTRNLLNASPSGDTMTLDDLKDEFGDRWDIARITGGYKATIREPEMTPIPRYGRTVPELAESIRMAEGLQ